MGNPAPLPVAQLPLLPLRDPAFALRECCKQLCLLEDHLVHADRQCPDCIGKHALTAEAFADEAVQLGDRTGAALAAAQEIRAVWDGLRAGQIDGPTAAERVRVLRKAAYASLP